MATHIDDYNNDYIDDYIFERRAVRGREPRNAVEDLAHRGRNPERFTEVEGLFTEAENLAAPPTQ